MLPRDMKLVSEHGLTTVKVKDVSSSSTTLEPARPINLIT